MEGVVFGQQAKKSSSSGDAEQRSLSPVGKDDRRSECKILLLSLDKSAGLAPHAKFCVWLGTSIL